MKRLLLWIAGTTAAAGAAMWVHPPARALLDIYPPARAAFEKRVAASDSAKKEQSKPGEGAKQAAGKGRGGGGAVPVSAAAVVTSDMPVVLRAPGTVEADATVGVRARVDGQIAEVLFKEGDLVRKDQVLFRLDDRLMRAQIKQAEANIARDRANLTEASATLERRNTLLQKKIVAESAMETAKATVEALKASIAAGQAALEGQRTQLDYLTIKAPITGRTGSSQANPGANVRAADTTPMVVINQMQPISVAFAFPQSEIAAVRRAMQAGAAAEIVLPGDKRETRAGKVDFIDNQVDKQTGTLVAKLQVPNDDEALWPGLAVDVALTVETRKGMLAVPASAVVPAQQGMIAWVIGADMRVQPVAVTLDRMIGQTAYLSKGVSPGDQVVTDGHVRIAAGTTVVVREPAATPPAGPAAGGPPATSKNEAPRGRPSDRKS